MTHTITIQHDNADTADALMVNQPAEKNITAHEENHSIWWTIAFVVMNAINPLLAMCLKDASLQMKNMATVLAGRFHPELFS